jgi:hypothetical protein
MCIAEERVVQLGILPSSARSTSLYGIHSVTSLCNLSILIYHAISHFLQLFRKLSIKLVRVEELSFACWWLCCNLIGFCLLQQQICRSVGLASPILCFLCVFYINQPQWLELRFVDVSNMELTVRVLSCSSNYAYCCIF